MNKASRVVLLGCISLTAVASANLEERIEALELSAQMSEQQNKLSLGGYGELHVNSKQDGGDSTFDYHRAVMYVGYQFNDWIRLNSEIELEHAKAGSGGKGYVLLEQFSLDLQLTDTFGVRLGRTLAPLGIVGPRHEPPLFYGVERPDMEKYILPSTWSIDGAGIFGDLSENVSYELYAVGGLDSMGLRLKMGSAGVVKLSMRAQKSSPIPDVSIFMVLKDCAMELPFIRDQQIMVRKARMPLYSVEKYLFCPLILNMNPAPLPSMDYGLLVATMVMGWVVKIRCPGLWWLLSHSGVYPVAGQWQVC